MTMPRGASRAIYTGNGQATEFPFFFKVFEEDQLSVSVTSPAGVTSEAAGWSAELDAGGGTVTYLHNGAPLPEGWKLAIMRDMPFVQEVDLITGTRFDPEVIETALDVATAERQQLLERLGRAVVVEPTDEGGPEALLADIRDARAASAVSAQAAAGSAAAAAASAQAAAGSCAIAAEEREAACVCAQESQAARDAAIAQAEAANTLMEAELAKVNAIVAANRTDQQAAVTAARAWAEKAPDTPVEYDEDGNPRYSAWHWADKARKLAVNPDGETVAVDTDGVLKALGGNLLLNSETWITASGAWVAPVTGWYELLLFGGGTSGYSSVNHVNSMYSGGVKSAILHLEAGEEVPVTVGAGGASPAINAPPNPGGSTSFAEVSTEGQPGVYGALSPIGMPAGVTLYFAYGAGPGGGYPAQPGENMSQAERNANCDARGYYGGSGAACVASNNLYGIGAGAQGSVRVRWHDPAKAAGPAPALFPVADDGTATGMRTAVQRSEPEPVAGEATPSAAQEARSRGMVVVNLYDPSTGHGSVWRAEDAEAKLADGFLAEAAWLAICAERTAEARAAWLADPATAPERFGLLRAARDGRLAATDYLAAPDYPLTEEERTAVTAYRQALRDLPAQEGAPWDGGGEAAPWPVMPLQATAATGESPCA